MSLESLDIKRRPVAYLSNSDSEIEELLKGSKKLSSGEDFVLLLKDDPALTERLLPAYLNAYLRKIEGCMKAGSLSMETLLFVAKTLRIGKAIAECGAEDNKKFLLFATSKKLAERFARLSKTRTIKEYKLSLDKRVASEIASVGLW